MATWTVIHERGPTSWGAYVPALSGLGWRRDLAEVSGSSAKPSRSTWRAWPRTAPIPDPASIEAETVAV